MVRVVNLCPYWTSPPRGGGQLRVHYLNKHLAEWHDVEQWSFRPTLNDMKEQWFLRRVATPAAGYREHRLVSLPALAGAWFADRRRVTPDVYISSLLRWSPRTRIRRSLASADIVQIEHPWLFDYVKSILPRGPPIVLATHNVESDLLRQQQEPISRRSIRRMEEIEVRALQQADAVLAVTEEDAVRLSGMSRRKDIVVVPHGVDTARFQPVGESIRAARKRQLGFEGKRVAIFTGGIFFPNRAAALAIRELAADFATEDFIFLVVGRAADRSHSSGNFRSVGFVEEILPYYEAADFALNPLQAGSGSSLKMLEFLAMGLPTLTTAVGARGLHLADGRNVLVRDVDHFADALRTLAADEAMARRIGAEGRSFVEENHSWREMSRRISREFERLLAARGGN